MSLTPPSDQLTSRRFGRPITLIPPYIHRGAPLRAPFPAPPRTSFYGLPHRHCDSHEHFPYTTGHPRSRKKPSPRHIGYPYDLVPGQPQKKTSWSPPRHRAPAKEWNMDYATAYLVNFLGIAGARSYERALEALEELRVSDGDTLLLQTFAKLDEIFFDGFLRSRVHVKLEIMHANKLGATYPPSNKKEAITIALNKAHLQNDQGRPARVLTALLHQMIHAYFLVVCPLPKDAEDDPRLEHGKHFLKIALMLKNMSECGHRHGSLPVDTGGIKDDGASMDRMADIGFYEEDDWDFMARRLKHMKLEDESNKTQCPLQLDEKKIEASSDVEKWYSYTCEPLLFGSACSQAPTIEMYDEDDTKLATTSRMELLDSSYAELIFGEKAIYVSRKLLNRFASMKKANKRIIKLPTMVNLNLIRALLEYVNGNGYEPAPPPGHLGEDGPPLIRPSSLERTPTILFNVKMHNLAVQLGFTELRDEAVSRLLRTASCTEYALDILQEVYDEKRAKLSKKDTDEPRAFRPEQGIRKWVKAFMARYSQRSSATEVNWTKLNQDDDFQRLLKEYPEMQADFEGAFNHLVRQGILADDRSLARRSSTRVHRTQPNLVIAPLQLYPEIRTTPSPPPQQVIMQPVPVLTHSHSRSHHVLPQPIRIETPPPHPHYVYPTRRRQSADEILGWSGYVDDGYGYPGYGVQVQGELGGPRLEETIRRGYY